MKNDKDPLPNDSGDVIGTESVKPHESSQSAASPPPQDLRSVLVTSVLNLEKLDDDLYRGTQHWVPRTQRLFGGQIIGQALVAAAKSISDNFYAHSIHCYFVRAGDPKVSVLYQVDHTRDGRSFAVRSVKAIQHGQPILICQASFQVLQPSPLQHQFPMPVVPQPEDLLTIEELIHRYLSKPVLTENAKGGLNKLLADEVPIDIKPVSPAHFHSFGPGEPRRLFWARARGYIGEGNMKLHCCVAAYISDFALLGTVLLPYSKYKAHFVASLDHAMWFHSTFRSDEWMLYECESPWAGSSRGLAHGRLWRRDGVLAATCSQEGVLRVKPVKESSKL
ncbi:acyl-coenzyme A thioesterase 8 [Austrofundulus limnaeus]|uniref:Acyl-coenzyme A thioesterase 8 n=1 Tax=Austrofundulus limnaeus TaxID=52670 RepID=A0A2I4CGP2_AUSLI|nr:PREDICTED: acyl-coenzyme A thioesterase 8 [Austrofundulus limnaeus]